MILLSAAAVLVITVAVVSVCLLSRQPSGNPFPSYVPRYTVQYSAGEGGEISGFREQGVYEGENADSVTARPHEGYYFIKWSDTDSTNPERTDCNVQQNITATAIFGHYSYTVAYESEPYGHISGNASQTVWYGEDATKIEAVPSVGYLFAGWSDGTYTNPRQDKGVTEDMTVAALYTPKNKTFHYDYNGATDNTVVQSITLSYDTVSSANFAIPQKTGYTFKGWYLEPEYKTKVTDEKGNLFYGYGVFYTKATTLYAKWVPEDEKDTAYPILMVFVDSAQAQLPSHDGSKMVDLDYKMPLITRMICELYPSQLSQHLQSIFEERVDFRVEAFYTTDTLQDHGIGFGHYYSNGIRYTDYRYDAGDIPQLSNICGKYRTIFTFCELGNSDLMAESPASGAANANYAFMGLDGVFYALSINNIAREKMLNPDYLSWRGELQGCMHEFAHTIEMCYKQGDIMDYHEALHNRDHYRVTKEYLLGELEKNGVKVGVPATYWTTCENVLVWTYYHAGTGGSVCASNINAINFIHDRIPYGSDGKDITAVPDPGYRFVRWSDGVTSATRKDENLISTLEVTAIFEKI